MNKPDFVEAYEGMVARLIVERPLEEAMSLAVGGAYEMVGQGEGDILQSFGLHNGMSIVDLGCGSGRLAHPLGKRFHLSYIGIDIVQEWLDFAKSKSPPHSNPRSGRLGGFRGSVQRVHAFALVGMLSLSGRYEARPATWPPFRIFIS